MYRLFSRVPNGLQPMAKIVQAHIERMGNEVINQREARINVRTVGQRLLASVPAWVACVRAVAGLRWCSCSGWAGACSETRQPDYLHPHEPPRTPPLCLVQQEEGEKDSNQDPAFVKALLALHDKFVAVVNQQFEKNSLFHKVGRWVRYGRWTGWGCVG